MAVEHIDPTTQHDASFYRLHKQVLLTITMADAQPVILLTTDCPAHYSLLTAHCSLSLLTVHLLLTTHHVQWPSTADAHPAIRALQQLLAELLTASEPGAAVAEATKAAIQAGEEAEAAAAAAAAALGGARTTTPFEVTISLT